MNPILFGSSCAGEGFLVLMAGRFVVRGGWELGGEGAGIFRRSVDRRGRRAVWLPASGYGFFVLTADRPSR